MADHYNKGIPAHLLYKFDQASLPVKRVIQAFNVDAQTNTIYILQREGTTSYLSRASTTSPNADGALVITDKMTLTNFGHSQTVERFEYNGSREYFWISCKAGADGLNFATQLARVQYIPGGTLDYTQADRLSSSNRANKTGKSMGTPYRIDGALDSSREHLAVVTIMDTTNHTQITRYSNAGLNVALDNNPTGKKYLSFGHKSVTDAATHSHVFQMQYPGGFPNNSFQGVELANNSAIYISGGYATDGDKIGVQPKIAYGPWSGDLKQHLVYNIYWPYENTEIEGMFLRGDNVLFGISYHNSTDPHPNRIYSARKADFY